MEIKVGSKWVFKNENRISEVLYVGEDIVFFKYLNDNTEGLYAYKSVNAILAYCIPYQEKYKWVKLDGLTYESKDNKYIGEFTKFVKQHEILFNYSRYREQFDKVDLDWKNTEQKKWYIEKNGVSSWYVEWDNYSLTYNSLGTLFFSTEEHAKTFLELLKENIHE